MPVAAVSAPAAAGINHTAAYVRGEQQGRPAVGHHRGRGVARGVVAGGGSKWARPRDPLLQRHDEQGHERHRHGGDQRPAAQAAPEGVRDRAGEDRQGDGHAAEVGEGFGEPGRAVADEGGVDALVETAQRAARGDLPGDDREHAEQRGEEESRPPRNRGGGSGAAAATGVPLAPGGVGRSVIRSVRSSGAKGSRGVREGTTRVKLGMLRPGIARSPLRAGCFSHLRKPYGRRRGTDSRNAIPPWAPHTFFTGGPRRSARALRRRRRPAR